MYTGKIAVAYLGNNNPYKFKRGVENVIESQAACFDYGTKYYIFFDNKQSVFRWKDIICIGIKNNAWKYLVLNLIIGKLKKKTKLVIHSHGPVKTISLLYRTDLLTVHDAIYYQRKGNGQRFNKVFYLVERYAYLLSRRIQFISEYSIKQSLADRLSKKIDIIYNTSFLEDYILNDDKAALKDSGDDLTYTLFAVRGIQKRTRIDLLIDFAEYVKDKSLKGKSIEVIVAGKGPLLQHYSDEIRKRGLTNIHLLGFIPDNELIKYYKHCDAVIMPCEHAEGFGLPIIEGYMFGKPVYGSNKCAIPEIIYSKEYLFENSPESIYDTLERTHESKVDFRQFYNKKYSFASFRKQMAGLYDKICVRYT